MSYDLDKTRSAAAPSSTLSKRFSWDSSRGFDPLNPNSFLDVQVSAENDGKVVLSVMLPANMMRGFVAFLESMMSLMSQADRYEDRALRDSRPIDLDELAQGEQFRETFERSVCELFRKYIRQGRNAKEAVKLTNSALKAQKHPWANHETVRSTLSHRGELRKVQGDKTGEKRKSSTGKRTAGS